MHSIESVHLYYRAFHEEESQNVEVESRVLFLSVSYMFLLLFIYYFVRKCIKLQETKYQVDVLPPADVLGYYYGAVVIIMGAIGLYSAIEDSWNTRTWIHYFFSNLLIAVLIYVYQTDGKYTLFTVCLFSVVMTIMLELLFIGSVDMQKGKSRLIIRNLISAVQGWCVISLVMAMGQWAVNDLRMSKHCMSILFFMFTVAITIILPLWNRQEGYGRWNKYYGFCISISIMLFVSMIRVCDREQSRVYF